MRAPNAAKSGRGRRSGGLWRLGGLPNLGHVPHLAARPCRALAVEVDAGAWNRQPLLVAVDFVPDQVGHRDRTMTDRLTQRPTGDRADVLLELRNRRAVQRPVPGIVNPRRDLVDQNLRPAVPLHHEHLDRKHADIVECVGDPLRDRYRLRRYRLGNRGRHARDLENVIPVLVFGDVETFDLTVGRAGCDHRNLALERNEGLQYRRFGADIAPGPFGIVAGTDDRLAFAVIAEATGLEHGGQADLFDRSTQGLGRRHVGIIGGGDAQAFDEIFFDQAILRGFKDFPRT